MYIRFDQTRSRGLLVNFSGARARETKFFEKHRYFSVEFNCVTCSDIQARRVAIVIILY